MGGVSERERQIPSRVRLTGRALNATVARAPWLWPVLRPAMPRLLRPQRRGLGRTHRGRLGQPSRSARDGHRAPLPRPRAGPRPRHRDRRGGALPRPRVPPRQRPRGRLLRGDGPARERQGRARPRGAGGVQGRRRLRPAVPRRSLRPRRPGQHAAVLRRDRPRAGARRARDRRRQPRRGDPVLHPRGRARARLSAAAGSIRSRPGPPVRGTYWVGRARDGRG